MGGRLALGEPGLLPEHAEGRLLFGSRRAAAPGEAEHDGREDDEGEGCCFHVSWTWRGNLRLAPVPLSHRPTPDRERGTGGKVNIPPHSFVQCVGSVEHFGRVQCCGVSPKAGASPNGNRLSGGADDRAGGHHQDLCRRHAGAQGGFPVAGQGDVRPARPQRGGQDDIPLDPGAGAGAHLGAAGV